MKELTRIHSDKIGESEDPLEGSNVLQCWATLAHSEDE